jgi:hypothetical protein
MRATAFLITTLFTSSALAETRHAEAHVHGVNHAQFILSGSTLQIIYEFPVAQLNENDEHKHDEHKHDELIGHLKEINSIEAVIAIPIAAKCAQTGINHTLRAVVSTGVDDENAGHQDAVIEATLDCQSPSALNSLDFSPAFGRFNDVEKIEVEGILGSQSLSETVTAKKAVISF